MLIALKTKAKITQPKYASSFARATNQNPRYNSSNAHTQLPAFQIQTQVLNFRHRIGAQDSGIAPLNQLN